MFRFFRKIRQNLLNEGKTARYFKYAIGEVVLVVIGILIALQLNNYNESLNQNIEEQKALNNLKLDFEYNKLELIKLIGVMKENNTSHFLILNQTGNKYQETFEIDKFLELVVSNPQYFPQNGFLMDLINSGKLGVIKHDNLRNKLSTWLPALETLKSREGFVTDFEMILIIYITKQGSWLNSDEMTSDEFMKTLKLPKSGFEIDNNDLLQNIEFENMIENIVLNKLSLLGIQEECLKLINEIIRLLEAEINK